MCAREPSSLEESAAGGWGAADGGAVWGRASKMRPLGLVWLAWSIAPSKTSFVLNGSPRSRSMGKAWVACRCCVVGR